jgi:uncharacterized protein (TIGR03083 family)
MQLTPRYGSPVVLRIDVPVGDPSVPLVRQRRRLAETLARLDDAQWQAASRCEGWSVQDVVAHLVDTNHFWAASMSAGLAGSPTRFLVTFDPVTSPAALVERTRELAPSDVLARYVESLDGLAEVVADVTDDAWSIPAEAPPGHVALRAVALHALWDAWTHERDIVVPLGLTQPAEPDEIRACLVYAAAISPTLLAAGGSARRGIVAIEATDPATTFVVEAGATVTVRTGRADDVADVELRGEAADLVEALTFRAPLACDVAPDGRWLLGGLAEVFDQAR